MIRVEVIEGFTLGQDDNYKFEDLKDIVRAGDEKEGELFVDDKFTCTKEMADYLLGNNKLGRAFVKVIEVIPEEEKKEITKKVNKNTKKVK